MYLVYSIDCFDSEHECSLDERVYGVVVLILLCKVYHEEACSSSVGNPQGSKDGLV